MRSLQSGVNALAHRLCRQSTPVCHNTEERHAVIIWSGLGHLVAIFVFASALLCNVAFDAAFGEGYYSAHKWTVGVAMFIAAGLSFVAARMLRRRTARMVIDKQTGEEFLLDQAPSTLFFIPMHYWWIVLGVLGLVLCLTELVD